jgi:two-component system, NtrC family, nitrogen regulation sensor histidine kinase NtrY
LGDWRIAVSFRLRLILAFAIVSTTAIAVLTGITLANSLRAFRANDARIAEGVIAQIKREVDSRGALLAKNAAELTKSDTVLRIGADNDDAAHSHDATNLAQGSDIDFLELLRPDSTIISSAHWPARYGYKEKNLVANVDKPFVTKLETESGDTLALVALRKASVGSSTVIVLLGNDLKNMLGDLSGFSDVRLWIYEPQSNNLVGISTTPDSASPTTADIARHLNDEPGTSFSDNGRTYFSLPMLSAREAAIAHVIIGRSLQPQRAFVRNLSLSALAATLVAILISIALGTLIARRITMPIEDLAAAADSIATGDWQQRVAVNSHDEIGRLAESFNTMTGQLTAQRDRLVQVERVAAWRELARRLAHELKNPLFPLQLTLETLVKARDMKSPDMDEIFRESTRTLHEEIDHLKTIVERFSDFSRMPTPEIQHVNVNDIVAAVGQLHAAQFRREHGEIHLSTDLAKGLPTAAADPILLRRVIENLTLNAIDAMPEGGELSLRTRLQDASVVIEVSDTGSGLTPEECERLFTPYYTTKQHGTGLGLAIVQSIVSDHHGRISVQSEKGKGTTFRVELPTSSARAATI